MAEPNGRGAGDGGPDRLRPGGADRGGREDGLVEELRALGRAVAVPAPPPDLAAAVLARLEPGPVPRRTAARRAAGLLDGLSRGRRALVVVVAALLLVVGAAPAGAAAARWLGLGGVVVVEAPGAPVPPPAAAPGGAADGGSGEVVSLADARARVPFALGVPAGLGDPDRVVLTTDGPAETTVVSMDWLADGVRLDQFAGRVDPVFVKRYGPHAEWLDVAGGYGVWLPEPHELEYIGPDGTPRVESARTSGPSLVWQRGGVTLRLEGVPTAERAVALADSVS
jgi:hypothetical protein